MPSNAFPVVSLNSTGGIPEVEVIFGQAQLGVYRCFLWDAGASNPKLLGHGNNVDGLPDRFSVGLAPTSLSGHYLSVEAVIQSPSNASGQLYSLTVLVRQDGGTVPGGLLQDNGQLASQAISLVKFVRFA
ncbi:MAG: hypothetical protein IPP07_31100 [Holophagales bacterium]|nr:hypothetical protein [Holophagales bacterium]MBK9969031.1 hypothetical protein [Holophagales bacterium]